jgi:hypothetical protein
MQNRSIIRAILSPSRPAVGQGATVSRIIKQEMSWQLATGGNWSKGVASLTREQKGMASTGER